MSKTVFYAWQAQRPTKANRGLIEGALEKALKALTEDPKQPTELQLEQDARGAIGAPEITATLLEKISGCMAFVADVTPVGSLINDKPTPNPNVMFELGFAWRGLAENRVILVLNRKYGAPDDLPFDISKRCLVQYEYDPDGAVGPADARNGLAQHLEDVLRSIVRDEPMEWLRERGLDNGDITLFRATFSSMLEGSDEILDYEKVLEAGNELGMSNEEVEDATQIIAAAGLWEASEQMGDHRFSHVRGLSNGFERYCNAYFPGYQNLKDRAARFLFEKKPSHAQELVDGLKIPLLLVEHLLKLLEENGYISIAGDSGGIYIMELRPKLRRAFRGE